MKVTLIQPKYFNIWEALGLAYIGAYIKKSFPGKLELSFYQGNFDDDRTIIEEAKTSDLVAFSCTSPVFRPALRLAEAIKEIRPEVKTIFGGFHPSAVPNDCLEEGAIDQVVIGEGEEAFLRQPVAGRRSQSLLASRGQVGQRQARIVSSGTARDGSPVRQAV